MAKVNLGITAL